LILLYVAQILQISNQSRVDSTLMTLIVVIEDEFSLRSLRLCVKI